MTNERFLLTFDYLFCKSLGPILLDHAPMVHNLQLKNRNWTMSKMKNEVCPNLTKFKHRDNVSNESGPTIIIINSLLRQLEHNTYMKIVLGIQREVNNN